jgi:hypothetical protein
LSFASGPWLKQPTAQRATEKLQGVRCKDQRVKLANVLNKVRVSETIERAPRSGTIARSFVIPDPRPLAPATWCDYATLPTCPPLAGLSASGGLVRLWRACPPLAGPTGPAQVSRAYLYVASPGRGVFQLLVVHGARLSRWISSHRLATARCSSPTLTPPGPARMSIRRHVSSLPRSGMAPRIEDILRDPFVILFPLTSCTLLVS